MLRERGLSRYDVVVASGVDGIVVATFIATAAVVVGGVDVVVRGCMAEKSNCFFTLTLCVVVC